MAVRPSTKLHHRGIGWQSLMVLCCAKDYRSSVQNIVVIIFFHSNNRLPEMSPCFRPQYNRSNKVTCVASDDCIRCPTLRRQYAGRVTLHTPARSVTKTKFAPLQLSGRRRDGPAQGPNTTGNTEYPTHLSGARCTEHGATQRRSLSEVTRYAQAHREPRLAEYRETTAKNLPLSSGHKKKRRLS